MLDLLITKAQVVDGMGGPVFGADVGIEDGHIVLVAPQIVCEAEKTIDAQGLCLAPGFIDVHSHSDFTICTNPRAESKVRQGVTTEVIGNCGLSAVPICPEHLVELQDCLLTTLGIVEGQSFSWDWGSFTNYLAHLSRLPPGVNLVPLVGHGTLRIAVMGAAPRPPTKEEMRAMEDLLKSCLLEGAFGMSTGLQYPPDIYSTTEELVRLGRVLACYDAVYASHIRSEGPGLFSALDEALYIGERSGCRVQISHLKAGGRGNWGQAQRILDHLDAARERGVQVTWDQYPYSAWGTALIDYVPPWVAADGRERLAQRLRDSTVRQRIKDQLARGIIDWEDPLREAPWEAVQIALVGSGANASLEGKTVAQIAAMRGQEPYDVVFDLLAEEEGAVKVVVFGIQEDDVRTIMKHPVTIIASDGRAVAPYGSLGRGIVHPRYYGTFPRVLGYYVRQERLLPLEQAVRKMTFQAAEAIGLNDRGQIAEGMVADIVIFDPQRIRDVATFAQPHRYAVGIECVLIGGQVVLDHGEHSGALCGQVLKPMR